VTYRQGRAGWSEIYYRQATSLNDAANIGLDIYDALIGFRDPSVVLDFIRIQDLTNPRAAIVLRKSVTRGPVSTATPDIVSTAAIYELTSDAPVAMRRRVWFRGLNDEDTIRSETTGQDLPSGVITNGVGALWIILKSLNCGIVGLVPISSAPYAFTSVDKVTVRENAKITVTTTDPFTLTTKNRVIISRMNPKQWPGLNGHWTAQNVTATTFDLQYSSALPPNDYPQTVGVIRPEEYRFAPFGTRDPAQFGFIALNKHATRGATPFGRGRRRTLRLRSR
jgi:hypothetical protein